MKRYILAGVGALALAVSTAPAALAQQDEYGMTTTSIAPGDACGTAIVTWTNSTPHPYWGDYRVGDEPGEADDATGAGPIPEGPLQGQPFGKTYNLTKIPANDEKSATVTVPEGTEPVDVSAWVKRGPENRSYSMAETVSITPCEPAPTTPPTTTPPTTTPPADDGKDTTTPPVDDDKNGGDKSDDDDKSDDQDSDDANPDGTAPTPEPQPAHIAVTG